MPNPTYPEVAAAIRIVKILDALDAPTKQATLQIVQAIEQKSLMTPPAAKGQADGE